MKVLFFAYLRDKAGTSEMSVSPPETVTDVTGLIAWLRTEHDGPAKALKDMAAVRIAVNQTYAKPEQTIGPDDEIAFFPPVTGGRS